MTEKPTQLPMNDILVSYIKEKGFVTSDEILEVLKSFQTVIETIRQKVEENKTETFEKVDGIASETKKLIQEKVLLEDDKIKDINDSISELSEEISDIREEISEIDFSPIEDDMASIISNAETKNSETQEELKPEKIRDKLETLKGDERLDKTAIKGLDEELRSIESKISSSGGRVGGGVTNLRIQQAFKYILRTEQPSGLINGSNTTYKVSNAIAAVISMTINGETIAQLPNYTVAGKTITFTSALPAVYSGKDFEIKYIMS